MDRAEVLLIGGWAGVGKSTVGWKVSDRLRVAEVAHAIIEGDFMGQVHPAPPGDPHRAALTERNLNATDETAERRLRGREIGSELERELAGSARKARLLDERAPTDTVRIATDGRTVVDISTEVPAATGWVTGS